MTTDRRNQPTLDEAAIAAALRIGGDVAAALAPPTTPPTITAEQAAREGRRWAEGTAAQAGGAAGPWEGTDDDVRLLPGWEYASATVVQACVAAAAERWRELVAERTLRRIEAANGYAERLLARLAAAAEGDGQPRLVGVTTAQLPIVAPGLTTPHGPLLVTVEVWERHGFKPPPGYTYRVRLPCLATDGWEHHDLARTMGALHDDIVQRVRSGCPGDRALAALVRCEPQAPA